MLAAIGVLVLALGTADLRRARAVRAAGTSHRRLRSIARPGGSSPGSVARPPGAVSDAVMRLRERGAPRPPEPPRARGVRRCGPGRSSPGSSCCWWRSARAASGPEVLSPPTVLATMAVVRLRRPRAASPRAHWASAEMAYIGLFTTAVDPAYELRRRCAAAVLLYRVAQWLVPIPLGWALLIVMRGDTACSPSSTCESRPLVGWVSLHRSLGARRRHLPGPATTGRLSPSRRRR